MHYLLYSNLDFIYFNLLYKYLTLLYLIVFYYIYLYNYETFGENEGEDIGLSNVYIYRNLMEKN